MEKIVKVWVCPTPECGNFYASSSAGDLTKIMNVKPLTQIPTFPHSRCPDCRDAGRGEVDRIPVFVTAVI